MNASGPSDDDPTDDLLLVTSTVSDAITVRHLKLASGSRQLASPKRKPPNPRNTSNGALPARGLGHGLARRCRGSSGPGGDPDAGPDVPSSGDATTDPGAGVSPGSGPGTGHQSPSSGSHSQGRPGSGSHPHPQGRPGSGARRRRSHTRDQLATCPDADRHGPVSQRRGDSLPQRRRRCLPRRRVGRRRRRGRRCRLLLRSQIRRRRH
ncbi:hypothetical protein GUJ93_ZPchr0002g24265 [Zizania palustris]|uniref:Uncharacterized protein n=1 Tax=Zizania palustris TaxID=103762 RepID=A0A8J5VA46_ZIZPA|nr:hypothetical protein GUJ93_ZPchr0002g24265 [Zizania palustris]